MPCTLFISDLHLDASRPRIIAQFLAFLESSGRQCASLYILGDLFEAWIGDDDTDEQKLAVVHALRQCADNGVCIHVMHGNRDFLLGEEFANQSGCELIDDPAVVDLYGRRVLLMHGDTLCTDDVEYQSFRSQVRDPQWQSEFLAKSLSERRDIARQLRETSHEAVKGKSEEIMDVNQEAVSKLLREHDVDFFIHGHTHRPAVHQHHISGRNIPRIVLGDWYQQGTALRWMDDGTFRSEHI